MTPAAAFAEREERETNGQTAERQGAATMERALTFQPLEAPYPGHDRGRKLPMTDSHHDHSSHDHSGHDHSDHVLHAVQSLNRLAFSATVHCLTGCAIGEVLGMVIGTALGWGNAATIVLAVALAFLFGYSLTMIPLLRSGLAFGAAAKLAFASDTISITIMEIVDNAIMLIIPGAMDAHLDSMLFWASLAVALVIAGIAAYPVNRWLISRGRGHAVVHGYHHH
jgi:hypothetical protein